MERKERPSEERRLVRRQTISVRRGGEGGRPRRTPYPVLPASASLSEWKFRKGNGAATEEGPAGISTKREARQSRKENGVKKGRGGKTRKA